MTTGKKLMPGDVFAVPQRRFIMKKAYDWFIKFLGVVFITVIAVPMALG